MNTAETPSLNIAVAGMVVEAHQPSQPRDNAGQARKIACIDLISKLENLHAKSMGLDRDDFIDDSGTIAGRMLILLSEFNVRFLTGAAAEQTSQEIDRALMFAETFKEVLKTRPIAHTFIRAFWKVRENVDVLTSHAELGEALVRACATAFYHTILVIGLDSDIGKEIDHSTVVFVNQLQQSWK